MTAPWVSILGKGLEAATERDQPHTKRMPNLESIVERNWQCLAKGAQIRSQRRSVVDLEEGSVPSGARSGGMHERGAAFGIQNVGGEWTHARKARCGLWVTLASTKIGCIGDALVLSNLYAENLATCWPPWLRQRCSSVQGARHRSWVTPASIVGACRLHP